MSRRNGHDPTGSVSLFPFLAVLISTMGSLILLLVVFMQQARHREKEQEPSAAVASSQQKNVAPTQSQTQADKLADLTWQINALSESREKTRSRLEEAKLKLSMTEDQIRQLQEQLDRLEKEAQQLETVRDRKVDAATAEATQLESIRAAIAATKVELATTREQAARQSTSFAIIPYKGASGTDRRPIYVECQQDRVIIQPEGIILVASDFEEPVGPNNPLATAMRAVREYWLNAKMIESAAHAYPLLIVRSQGAHTYAACRMALRGWDDEFGYELIPDAMKLKYPPVDPSLARVLTEAVRDSRVRANLPDPGGAGDGTAQGGSARAIGNVIADVGGGRGGNTDHGGPDSGSGGEPSRPDGAPPWNGDGEGNGGTQSSGTEDQAHQGSGTPTSPQAGGPLSGAFADANGSGTPGATGGPVGMPGMFATVEPLSASHGENWALPNSAGNSIGMSRPVTVFLDRNRLILPPMSGNRSPAEEFAFKDTVQTAIPPFVDALWRRIDSWGTAGYGAYWKPTLQVGVHPQAEDVFLLFERLLENSGLQVERRREE